MLNLCRQKIGFVLIVKILDSPETMTTYHGNKGALHSNKGNGDHYSIIYSFAHSLNFISNMTSSMKND